jgi:hypothetical protein
MINWWHSLLGMPRHDKAWHEQDLADELGEYNEETLLLKKWSELSDVVYTCTRSRWSGHDIAFPLAGWQYPLGVLYMIPKYTGRYLFFRNAGKRAGSHQPLREVRNPKKTHKLHHIAKKYDLDPIKFQQICEQQLKHWLLLP